MNKKQRLEADINNLKKEFNIIKKSNKIKAKSKGLSSYLKSLNSDETLEFLLYFFINVSTAIHKKSLKKVLENMSMHDDYIELITNELYPSKIKLKDLLI